MAYDLFLNFEKVSIMIIEAEIAQMSDDNLHNIEVEYTDDINDELFRRNIYHGSIAITFIVNLFETALNTIICRKLGCKDIRILQKGYDCKLKYICSEYQVDYVRIKGDKSYAVVKEAIKLRNDITHYKSNEIGLGHYISKDAEMPIGDSKKPLSEMFTQAYMNKCYNQVLKFLELLCCRCGLVVNMNCEVVDSDGRDELCEFIITKAVYDERIQSD